MMGKRSAKHEVSGVLVATITPFRCGSLEIDYGLLEKHIEFLGQEGAHGIVPAGTNGEFPALTLEEKKKVIEVAGAARGDMFLMAGCGSCSLPEVLELVACAEDAGADAALIVPPFYYSDVGEQGVIAFYQMVLDAAGIPIFLYNIPMYSGVAITNGMIDALMEFPNLGGIKDTGGDIGRTSELVERYAALKIFGGSDSQAAASLGAGAAGIITGAGNAFPGLLREIWDARDKKQSLLEAGQKVKSLREALTAFPWVSATKYAVSLRGLSQTCVRPPLADLTDEEKMELRGKLTSLAIL